MSNPVLDMHIHVERGTKMPFYQPLAVLLSAQHGQRGS
jgi:hypothetical protein